MNELHEYAREVAAGLQDPDKKQLRFNEIVETAARFYPGSERAGVRELVRSCDKSDLLYVKGHPMWQTLNEQYRFYLDE